MSDPYIPDDSDQDDSGGRDWSEERRQHEQQLQHFMQQIPAELRAKLSPEDIATLETAADLDDFIATLQAIRERKLEDVARKNKFDTLLEEFFAGKSEKERRLIASLFQALRRSMISLTQNSSTTPADSPITDEAIARREAENKKWESH